MKNETRISRVAGSVLVGAFLLVSAPVSFASAAVSINTDQVLPPQGETCAAVGVSDVRPYIYDGALHSFDVSVTDASYVGIAAQVGERQLPFTRITRHVDASGNLRLHVDIETTPLDQDTLVSLTMMTSRSGVQGASCITSVSSVIPAQGGTSPSTPAVPAGTTTPIAVPTTSAPSQQGAGYPWGQVSHTEKPVTHKPVKQPGSEMKGTSSVAVAPLVTATHSIARACTTPEGASKLWFVLLVLYAAFVAYLASMRLRDTSRESDWSIPLTVLGFLGLLFFWYLSAACRTGAWAPIVATIIACAGLITMTLESGEPDEVLLLADTKEGEGSAKA